jgi:hypothetical protein
VAEHTVQFTVGVMLATSRVPHATPQQAIVLSVPRRLCVYCFLVLCVVLGCLGCLKWLLSQSVHQCGFPSFKPALWLNIYVVSACDIRRRKKIASLAHRPPTVNAMSSVVALKAATVCRCGVVVSSLAWL